MSRNAPIRVVYVTSNEHKKRENELLYSRGTLADGTLIADHFAFEIQSLSIKEVLDVDIAVMVVAEVTAAYAQLKVPCIVEHAGLVFDGHESYPGGLTKPMWNALGDSFVAETQSAGREVVARAHVAYCDGMKTRTFVGETRGTIAVAPRGSREFYWDTVFIPHGGQGSGMTYAELVDRFGLEHKVLELSQSTKAIKEFLAFRLTEEPALWRATP